MMKKVLVLGMVVATLLSGCGKNDDSKIEEAVLEEETNYRDDNFGSSEAHFVHVCYPAVECILGEEVRYQEVKYDDNGFYIDNEFISFDMIDEHCVRCDKLECS